MNTLTPIEAECDYALQMARWMADWQARASAHPIARRSFLYQAARCKKSIVNAAIRVEIWLEHEQRRARPGA